MLTDAVLAGVGVGANWNRLHVWPPVLNNRFEMVCAVYQLGTGEVRILA